MAKYKRGLSGSQEAATGGTDGEAVGGKGRDNTTEAAFWVSHRGGPFLIHDNQAEDKCEPLPIDNAGYLDDYDAAIEQGFAPCPKCS